MSQEQRSEQLYYMVAFRDGQTVEILNNDGSRMFLTWTEAVQWKNYHAPGLSLPVLPFRHKTNKRGGSMKTRGEWRNRVLLKVGEQKDAHESGRRQYGAVALKVDHAVQVLGVEVPGLAAVNHRIVPHGRLSFAPVLVRCGGSRPPENQYTNHNETETP